MPDLKKRPDDKTVRMPAPVGEMKRLVTLVDRGDADQYFFPIDADTTTFLPNFKPYHNFAHEILELPYTGAAAWGQRITFTLPFPWQGDCLNWVAFRFTPQHWLPGDMITGLLQSEPRRWKYGSEKDRWMWASTLGSSAIALVEMEVNGIVVEQWPGDWIDVWSRVFMDSSRRSGWTDSVTGAVSRAPVVGLETASNGESLFFDNSSGEAAPLEQGASNEQTVLPTEDGNLYAFMPFWFGRRKNAAFPIASIQGEGGVRFHITLRKFDEVVRRAAAPRACGESPLGQSIGVVNRDTYIDLPETVHIPGNIPLLKDAIMLCSFTHLEGEMRDAYIQKIHQTLIEPVINISFTEPLKYAINTGSSDTITVSLPLEAANGPVREVIWFLRRKAVSKFNSWTNYGAYLEDEVDPIYRPQRSLLTKAVLRVGSVVWADQNERWWRARGALAHSGGSVLFGSYIYAYSFAQHPEHFGPTGSINASRAELRLDLTIQPPDGVEDKEWEVQVFIISHNWIRFQNGMAERLFAD